MFAGPAIKPTPVFSAPQAVNEIRISYNTITLTHQYDHQDDVPVLCNGLEEQPLRYNALTGDHHTTIFRPEGTICNLTIGDSTGQSTGGFDLSSATIVETLTTPERPVRGTRYFVSPDGTGVSMSLVAPGSLAETLASDLEDAEIFFLPGVYQDVGEIRADNVTGVSLIGNGSIIDGSGRNLHSETADTWVPIGNGVWENTNPEVVDPNYMMMLFDDHGFGTGMVIQHAGTSADRQEAHTIDYDCYWSTSPDKSTWWMRLNDDESPAEHRMVRFSKEFGILFTNSSDVWVESLQFQNFGKVTAKGVPLSPNRNRMLEFQYSSDIVVRQVKTRHSRSQGIFFFVCNDLLIEECETEHRRFLTHNRETLKPLGEPLLRYGWESASSIKFIDCCNVVARNCEAYGVTDWCKLQSCSNADIHGNRFTRVVGEALGVSGDCQNVRYWNNRISSIEIQGPFAMQSRTGPVWYINNASIDSGGWTPKDDLSGEIPADDDLPSNFQFLGWSGSTQKFNTGSLPIIGQVFFFNNTGIINHTFEQRYIWDSRQSAFSFGKNDQLHSDARSRNNVWSSSGIGFSGGHPLDNLDFEYDQIWAGNLQGLGWKYLYPHGVHLRNSSDSTHATFEDFRLASRTYREFGVELEPKLDTSSGNPFNVSNRVKGELLPGITGNPVFNSPEAMTGAFLFGD